MSRSWKARRKDGPPTPAVAGRGIPRSAAVLLGLAVVAGGVLWWSTGRHADPPAAVVLPAMTVTSPQPAAAAAAPFQKIEGRWVRIDGGYVVEIRSVEASGEVDAAYFNPRPIHVAAARASQDGEAVKLFIELRDVNYPGSTYTLRYDAARDTLEGTYFQALEQHTYEVSFARR